MAVLSGIKTAVDGIPSVALWRVTFNANPAPLLTAGSQEALVQQCGIEDWEGDIIYLGYTASYVPGDELAFVGSIDGSKGVTGDALVQRVVIAADYQTNRYFTTQLRIVGNGALTFGTASATDTTMPTPVCRAGKKVVIGSTELSGIIGWRLSLEREMLPYVSNDTSGVVKNVVGAFSATLILDAVLSDASIPSLDTNHDFKLYVSDTAYWQVDSMRLTGIEDYGVDLIRAGQRREPPAYRMTFTHSAASDKYIKDPSASPIQVWPPAV